MKIAYFDSRARPDGDRLNYTDLVMYREGFCNVARGDVLLALATNGDDLVVERRLAITEAAIGGDSLDLYCEPVELVGATTIARGDSRLDRWWPQLRAYPVEVPNAVAAAMGWR